MSELPFDRVLTVVNPKSRRADRARSIIGNLQGRYGKASVEVALSLPNVDDHREMLQEKIMSGGRGTWMAVLGGDGLWGASLPALANEEVLRRCGKVGVAAFRCGTINDAANCFLPGTRLWQPYKILERACPVAFQTGKLRIKRGDEVVQTAEYAAYASAITTPWGAEHANSDVIRNGHAPSVVRKLQIVKYALDHSQTASVRRPHGMNIRNEWLREIILPLIDRMAGRPLRDVDPTQSTMHVYTAVAGMSPLKALAAFGIGTLHHEAYGPTYSVAVGQETKLQCDGETILNGEPLIAPADSTCIFTRNSVMTYPLSTAW